MISDERLAILDKTGSADVRDLVAEVRGLKDLVAEMERPRDPVWDKLDALAHEMLAVDAAIKATAVSLGLVPTDDPELTCIVCGGRPVDREIHVYLSGRGTHRRAALGLHSATCAAKPTGAALPPVSQAETLREDADREERDEWSKAAALLGLARYGGAYRITAIVPAVRALVEARADVSRLAPLRRAVSEMLPFIDGDRGAGTSELREMLRAVAALLERA